MQGRLRNRRGPCSSPDPGPVGALAATPPGGTHRRANGKVERGDETAGVGAKRRPHRHPPPAFGFLVDEAQGTAVSLQYFATAEDMAAGAEVLSAMDSGETPGTRVSVDTCEIELERDFG
jgi:hypothetical protein